MKKTAMDPGRRDLLKLVAAVPLAAAFALSPAQAQTARERMKKQQKGPAYAPKFFNAHEWATVNLLVDIVIPRDERSGSATDAKVPEFMDFILDDPLAEPRQREANKVHMRGGLAWLDRECGRRFGGRSFLELSDTQRTAVLDSIAFPKEPDDNPEHPASYDAVTNPDKSPVLAPPAAALPGGSPASPGESEEADAALPLDRLSHGVAFFSAFRDLTASGFWSSEIGVKDIEYTGNRFVAEWNGCPPEVLVKLGLSGEKRS